MNVNQRQNVFSSTLLRVQDVSCDDPGRVRVDSGRDMLTKEVNISDLKLG